MAQSGTTSLFPTSNKAKLKRQSQSIVQQSTEGGRRHQYSQSVMGLESIAEEGGTKSLFSIVDLSNTSNNNQTKQKSSQQYIVQDYLNNSKDKRLQAQHQDDFFFEMTNPQQDEETKSQSRFNHSQLPIQDSSKLMIDTMLQDCRHFIVRGRQLPFNENDEVFNLQYPAVKQNQNETGKCQVCLVSFKALKNLAYCDFCGFQVCKTSLCLVKTRPFPKNTQGQKGHVCQICDRKFYIRDLMTFTIERIEHNKQYIAQLQRQVVTRDKECKSIEEEMLMYKEISVEEQARQESKGLDVKRQKEVLEAEMLCINDDYKVQHVKRQAIMDEMNFLQDTMDEINTDMEVRDEEILKLRIKIRQEDLEREKLEGQIQHLRRQISKGHQSRGKNAQQKPSNNPTNANNTNEMSQKQILGSRTQSLKSPSQPQELNKSPIDDPNDEMFFQQGEDTSQQDINVEYLHGSTSSLPRDQQLLRSTMVASEMETQGNEDHMQSFSGIRAKKLAKKQRKDNQSFCGTPGHSGKCNIF